MSFSKSPKCPRNRPNARRLALENIRYARKNWEVSGEQVVVLKTLTEQLRLSVALGDLRLLDSKWYVTHSGLMRLARRNHCAGIQVSAIREFCDMDGITGLLRPPFTRLRYRGALWATAMPIRPTRLP